MAGASELISQYGYVAVLLGSLVEGDGVAVLGGIAVRHGYLEFFATVGLAALGGMIGDQCLFFLGRRYGDRLLQRFHKHQARIERVRLLVHRHQSWWVIGVRFAYGFRLIGPLIIGSSGVSARRFVVLNIIGALLWALVMVSLGYCAGELLHRLVAGHRHFELWLAIALVWVVLLAVGMRLLIRSRRRTPGKTGRVSQ